MDRNYSGARIVKPIYLSIDMEKTGANIKKHILANGYSIQDIMDITGISTAQAVYKWYKGKSIPAIETLLVLCKVLDFDIEELLVIDGELVFFANHI